MTTGGPDTTRRAFELFDEAVDLPSAEWEAWVADRAEGDEDLAAAVLALLRAHAAQGPLDRPIPTTWSSPDGDAVEADPSLASVDARIAEALAERYDGFERLGAGGMGVVFRARERKHDRAVVLKVLRPEVGIRHGEDRFLQEVRLASGLTHPHILAFIDSGRADGLLYYVMPFVEGETLHDRLRRDGPLSPEVAQPLLRDVADALAYAHGQGVVHRDLKPANVLCSGDHAYLMDFGIAKALQPADTDDGLTRPGFSPGTPRYMAPEQLEDGSVAGAPSDVFAWGQLAHEVLTGTVIPGSGSGAASIVERLNRSVPSLPPAWAPLIARALATAPEARPTASDLYEALRFFGAGKATGRRRRWTVAAAAAAGIATLVVLGVRDSGGLVEGQPTGSLQAGPIAVAEFRNETGDADLDFLGRMAGDWITQGLLDLEGFAVVPWALSQELLERVEGDSVPDPVRVLGSETGAGTVITGRYYRVGDQISFRADITDAVGLQVLAGTSPLSAPVDHPELAVEELRERLLGALSALTGERSASNSSVVRHAPRLDAYRAFDSGRRHHVDQDYELARDEFLHAHELDTTFLPALLSAAPSANNVGDEGTYDSVMTYLGARRDRLSRFDDLRWQFLDAIDKGDRQRALRALRETVAMAPGDRGTYNLSLIANSLNRPQEALAALEMLDPDAGVARGWAQYWTQLAQSLHLLGRYAEEAEAAASMVRRHPERSSAVSLLTRALAASGQLEALEEALSASALRPPRTYWSHGGALLIAGQSLMAHGNPETAQQYLQDAEDWLKAQIQAAPDYVAHQYWLANVLYSQKRWEEAADLLEDMMAKEPANSGYRGLAGVVATWQGDTARAAVLLDPDAWSGPESSRLRYTARAAAAAGDLDRALADLSSALEMGISSYGWAHGGGHHEFALMRQDPRIERLLEPIESGS